MSRIGQAIKAAFLLDFWGAVGLGFKYLLRRKATINYPFEKNPLSPRFAASTLCVVIQTEKSAALPVSCVRQSVRRKQLQLRLSPGKMVPAGPLAMTST